MFNALTGLNQHTGNWPGKTVTNAIGEYRYEGDKYVLVDVPGTYSLSAQSADEEAARDFICFSDPDVCIIVVDATCLERNLNLVLQILEYTQHVVVCLNLMDEAQKKKIQVDAEKLSHLLGVQVVCTQARSGKGLDQLRQAVEAAAEKRVLSYFQPTQYDEQIENAVACIGKHLEKYPQTQKLGRRWTALRILEADEILQQRLCEYLNVDLSKDTALQTVGGAFAYRRFAGPGYRNDLQACGANCARLCTNGCSGGPKGSYGRSNFDVPGNGNSCNVVIAMLYFLVDNCGRQCSF